MKMKLQTPVCHVDEVVTATKSFTELKRHSLINILILRYVWSHTLP